MEYGPGMEQPPGPPQGPGLFGTTAGALLGVGAPHYQRVAYQIGMQDTGASLFGGSAVQTALQTAPALAGAGFMGATMLGAPLLEHGASTAAMRGVGRGLRMIDPFTWGGAMGRGALGGAKMGLGLGKLGGFGKLAGMMGGGLLAYTVISAAVTQTAGQMLQGATDSLAAQGMTNQLGRFVAPGQSTRGQGGDMAQMLSQMSQELKVSTGELQQVAGGLTSIGAFQTSSDLREFKEKFREIMGAVKEIAKVTQSSIQDATRTFAELRSQGFYTTSGATAQAAIVQARATVAGISPSDLMQGASYGAGVARQLGMRGRTGAEAVTRWQTGIAMGVRGGYMSEEAVEEMGGVQQVGATMAAKQMSFLSTPRGRAIIAAMMGSGGAPDSMKMSGLMSGNMTMEDIVTRAAESGLGTLRQAGSRESRQAFEPYAGMAQIMIAGAQSRQLWGGVNERSMLTMLGTMGWNRDQAQILLQSETAKAGQMMAEMGQQRFDSQMSEMESLKSQYGLTSRVGRWTERSIAAPLRGAGASLFGAASGRYRRSTETASGVKLGYSGGDSRLAAESNFQFGDELPGGQLTLGDSPGFLGNVWDTIVTGAVGSQGTVGGAAKSIAASALTLGAATTYRIWTSEGVARQWADWFGAPTPEKIIRKQYEQSIVRGSTYEGDERYIKLGKDEYIERTKLESLQQAGAAGAAWEPTKQQVGELGNRIAARDTSFRLGIQRAVANQQVNVTDPTNEKVYNVKGISSEDWYASAVLLASQGQETSTLNIAKFVAEDSSPEALLQRREQARGLLRAVGTTESAKLLEDLGPSAPVDLSQRVEAAGTQEAYKNTVKANLTEYGLSAGEAERLADLASRDGRVNQALHDYMRHANDPEYSNEARLALENLLPDDVREGSLSVLHQKLTGDSSLRGKAGREYMRGGLMGARGAERAAHQTAERRVSMLRGRAQGLQEKADALGLGYEGDKLRLATMRNVAGSLHSMAAGAFADETISDEERAYLADLYGWDVGATITSTFKAAQQKQTKGLKDAGLGQEAIDRILSANDSERAQVVLEELEKAGVTTKVSDSTSGPEGQTLAGMTTDYVEANAAFVRLVYEFIHTMKDANIPGLDLSGLGAPDALLYSQ